MQGSLFGVQYQERANPMMGYFPGFPFNLAVITANELQQITKIVHTIMFLYVELILFSVAKT